MRWRKSLVVKGRIFDPSRGLNFRGSVLIIEGRIAEVREGEGGYSGLPLLEAGDLFISPGFIDLHAHLREPGFEHKETIASGTAAAARGGFTAVCAMPNTSPPADRKEVVEFVRNKAEREGKVRVLPVGCATKGREGRELSPFGELREAGAVALSDDGNPISDSKILRAALEQAKMFDLPIFEHPEDPALAEGVAHEGPVAARLGLSGIPAEAEEIAVRRGIALAELTGGRIHFLHLSSRKSVEAVREAKERGVNVSAEVTPHHLFLTEERLLRPLPYDPNAKVRPPLRSEEDRRALIQGLREGVIDAVATDHAPHAPEDKLCEFDRAEFGISGLETAFGVLMTLVRRGELDLPTVILRLTRGPASILRRRDMGILEEGALGDLVIYDPHREWIVDPEEFASKGKNTPLAGEKLWGKIMATVVGGEVAFREEEVRLIA